MNKTKCPGCGVEEGYLHEEGCGKEICPFCDCQLLFCGCWETKLTALGFEIREDQDDEFEVRLPDEWEQKWQAILNEKGRIPFIEYPTICAKCGKVDPELFMVPDRIWEKYIQPTMRNEVLCRPCFDFVVDAIDTASND